MSNKNEYFAALPTNEIGEELLNKKDIYYRYIDRIGHFALLRNSFNSYYKPGNKQGSLYNSGMNNEYVEICVNHFRNLVQHVLSMVTSQRPHFEPKAANTDYKSMAQAQLASGLLEYYNRIKKMERYIKIATETALVYGEGFVFAGWNPTQGEQFGDNPETGAPIYEGDVEFENLNPIDVIRDVFKDENSPHNWTMIRRYRNKYDQAAKYPELKDRILDIDPMDDRWWRINLRDVERIDGDLEDIPVYTFFHRPTEALPDGRMVEFSDSDVIYHDGPLPYRELPVYRLAPAEKTGTILGYTNAWDMLPLQEAIDKLYSTAITNQAAFGVQNIGLPKGNDLNVTQMSGGLNIIEFDAKTGPPVPIQLTSTPPEVFTTLEQLKDDMRILIGLNSVSVGDPESSLKSGSALALVQSMAIQFSQGLQQSYVQLLEDLGTAVINLLRDYATVPRIALIAGKSQRANMKAFKGDDLALINRVIVDMGNPLTRTTAGRVNIAEQLIQLGMVQSPEQYLEVLTTGRIEPVYEGEVAELTLIRAENEQLFEGNPEVSVVATDDHDLHIREHKVVLSSPEARQSPELVAAVLQHIALHQQFLQPQQLAAPDGQPVNGIAQDEAGAVPEAISAVNPVTQEAADVNLPSQPSNPLTDRENDPSGGIQ